MSWRLLSWWLAGALGGALLGVADAAALVFGAGEMFLHTKELVRTAIWSVGICSAAGAIAAGIAGAAFEGLAELAAPGRALAGRLRAELAGALLMAGPCGWALWSLTSGPQASQLWAREAIVALGALIVSVATALAIGFAARRWGRSATGRLALGAAGLALAAALHAVDSLVLVRLYPLFHFACTLLALLSAAAGLRALRLRKPGRLGTSIGAALVLAALVAGAVSLHAVRSSQNPRFVVKEKTAAAADVVAVARALLPPPRRWRLDEIATAADDGPIAKETAAAASISAPGSSIFLITIDAMRGDRLLPKEGTRAPAPNLDALARRSVVFERAYTPIPHTSYAITSLMTGKYVRPLFDVPGAPRVHETWAEILDRFGYRTAAFFTKAVFFIDRPRFEPYLRSCFGFDHCEKPYRAPAEQRVDAAIEYLESLPDDGTPVFLWLHLFEPHEPYERSCTRFGEYDEARYDCEIAVADAAAGRLLDYVERHYPRAILIAAADHGEEFGEHGGRYHGTSLYDEQIRVPLAVRVPGVEHRVVGEPVNLVDLPGTVLGMLDVPVPPRIRSRDLGPLMLGEADGGREALAERDGEVMVVRGGHKLICDEQLDVCRLHDLVGDPDERRSLTEQEPRLARRLLGRIRAWNASHARLELRPVETERGTAGWPRSIRRALAGDESVLPDLLVAIEKDRPDEVRRKAAELVAKLVADRGCDRLAELDARGDDRVAAWLAVARARCGDLSAEGLAGVGAGLEPLDPARRALVLQRLELGDASASRDAAAIALAREAPHEQRVRALELLAERGDPSSAAEILPLVEDYRYALPAAAALAALGHRPAVDPLLERLERERFPERRAAIARALGKLKDRRAVRPLAGELAGEEPAPGALAALVELGAARRGGRRLAGLPGGAKVELFQAPGEEIRSRLAEIDRAVLLARAEADAGAVAVLCDGARAGSVPLSSGEQASAIELKECKTDGRARPRIELRIEPHGIEAEIRAAALIDLP
ncbi:MAG: sulfatase-like hydrolase/transferase [Polyangia bacterium]